MDITPVRYTPPTATQVQPASAAASVAQEPQQPQAQPVVNAVENPTNDNSQEQAENARRMAVERAAQTLQKAFPEMETFTIFRSNTGEFVTRITNHTSGTVKYVPEQTMLRYITGKEAMPEGMLALNV